MVQIIQVTSNLSAASRLDWDALQRVMERAVERAMERREEREMPYLGVDEKNFGKGQDYVSILTDIAGSRILEVVEDRTQAAAESLFEALSEEQRDKVEAVAMDMSQAYRNAAEKCVPGPPSEMKDNQKSRIPLGPRNGGKVIIKAQARSFRDFANYRVRIHFHCGRFDLFPRHLPIRFFRELSGLPGFWAGMAISSSDSGGARAPEDKIRFF